MDPAILGPTVGVLELQNCHCFRSSCVIFWNLEFRRLAAGSLFCFNKDSRTLTECIKRFNKTYTNLTSFSFRRPKFGFGFGCRSQVDTFIAVQESVGRLTFLKEIEMSFVILN